MPKLPSYPTELLMLVKVFPLIFPGRHKCLGTGIETTPV